MASKPVSSWQFWAGILVTVGVSVLSYIGTKEQIGVQRAENQRVHDSQRLREMSGAVSAVRQQLMSHAGALLELESCMSRKGGAFSVVVPHSIALTLADLSRHGTILMQQSERRRLSLPQERRRRC